MTTVQIVLALVGAVLIACVALFAVNREGFWARVAGPADLGRYDFSTLKRRASPNDALACTPGACDDAIALPAFDDEPAALIEAIATRVAATPGRHARVDDGADPAYLRYVTWSPRMRFPDTVDIEAMRLADGRTGLRAYARAQIGLRDFGANAARLKAWLDFSESR